MVIRRDLNRADRRILAGNATQPAHDLLMMRLGVWVYVGIAGGGRVKLTVAQARQAAGALLEISDDEPADA
jgi:hypothetical protein